MREKKFIRAAIDWDGVIVEKKGLHDPRNWAKMGLRPHEGVHDGLALLGAQADVQVMGLYTARPEWFRGLRTRRQQAKFGIPGEIHHVKGHYSAKVETVLVDAAFPESRDAAKLEPPPDLSRVVLIDDVHHKIMDSVKELRPDPRFQAMLDALTIVAFGKQPEDIETGIVHSDLNLQVVTLPSWRTNDIDVMLEEIREHAAA